MAELTILLLFTIPLKSGLAGTLRDNTSYWLQRDNFYLATIPLKSSSTRNKGLKVNEKHLRIVRFVHFWG